MLASAARVLALRERVERRLMPDTCVIGARSLSDESNTGAPIEGFTDGSAVACQFQVGGGRRTAGDEISQLEIRAVLRLPHGTVVAAGDRVKITKQWSQVLNPVLVYIVDSPPEVGTMSILCRLEAYQT